jgi:hypothetical protein
MLSKKMLVATLFIVFSVAAPLKAHAFDVTGGQVWHNRVGPGLSFSLGLNGCLRDYCDDVWDTGASIGSTVGFFYRIIPNLVVFADLHTGHIPVDYDSPVDVDKDNGFVFQATGGAEFHLPVTGWVAPFAGFGMGFAYLGVWGKYDIQNSPEFHGSLRGLDFQLRFGADFFPFSQAPSLSIGPVLYWSIPHWITMCSKDERINYDECDDPDDMLDNAFLNNYDDDLPFILYFGVAGKYKF